MAFKAFKGGPVNPFNIIPATGNVLGYSVRGTGVAVNTVALGALAANGLAAAGSTALATAMVGGLASAASATGLSVTNTAIVGVLAGGTWPVLLGVGAVLAISLAVGVGVRNIMGDGKSPHPHSK